MKFNKNLIAAGLISTVAAGSMIGASASAQSDSGSSLIDKIATTFSLDRTEVEAAFEEHKDEKQADRAAAREEHLQSKVDDGTITADQKTALEAKFEEMKTQREALKDQDLTRDEMREQMKENREELKTWAEAEGINLDDVRPEGGHGRKGHGRGGPGNQSEES